MGDTIENGKPHRIIRLNCARCKLKRCASEGHDCPQLAELTRERLLALPLVQSMQATADMDTQHRGQLTRLEEIIAYARRMNYSHLGVAFCIGLEHEARQLDLILRDQGFKVSSAICKVGGLQKKDMGLGGNPTKEFDASCNPLGQALILNEAGSDFNLIVGLCVGHEQIFMQNSQAPVTTFVVKDRVLGHNPVMALYVSYIRRRFNKRIE